MYEFIPENPYILLTPGPLSTSKGVRNALLRDWCTWDEEYNVEIVQNIRERILKIATSNTEAYTTILLQGSGSFAIEACLGTVVPRDGKILILTNGAYGDRMVEMARVMGLNYLQLAYPEMHIPDMQELADTLAEDKEITHVAFVHCETTTGILNPLKELSEKVKAFGKILIVDAMSSFGGIPMDISDLDIDFIISSANKCIQGVPGFCFVVAKKSELEKCEGNARSLVLDLFDQWKQMDKSGKWRYTSPTHVVRAFYQALNELEDEGGIAARFKRYQQNHRILVAGMNSYGFETLLPAHLQSPIITSFLYPTADFNFDALYKEVKSRGFVLYPGKISKTDTFRIGNIGEVYPQDIETLICVIGEAMKG